MERGGDAIGTGSGSRDRERERELQRQADVATAQIKPTDYELYQKPADLQFIKDLDSGKDVRGIDSLRWHLNLFDNAATEPNLSGVGLLGDNALAGGNSGMLGLIGKQIAARTQQEAQGNLYNSVQDARGQAQGRLSGFTNIENSRNLSKAQLANDRYSAFLQRPKQPSLWQTILGGGLGALGTWAGAGFKT